MFDKIIFEKICVRHYCSVIFRKHTIFKSEIVVGNYTFSYEFNEDDTTKIADLLNAFYGVIKDELYTLEQTNKLERYYILQDALKTIIKE